MTYIWTHPSGKQKAELVAEARKLALDIGDKVVPSLKDYSAYFKGDWNAWATSIPRRQNTTTGKPLYQGVLLTQQVLGKATAQIVNAGLLAGLPVRWWDGKVLIEIGSVRTTDPNNWQAGWEAMPKTPESAEDDESAADFKLNDDPFADLFEPDLF